MIFPIVSSQIYASGAEDDRYHTSPNHIDPVTRDLLENYSKIPSDQVKQHVVAIVSFPNSLP